VANAAAVKELADAKTAARTAQTNLKTATQAADDAKKQLADAVAAKKAADQSLAGLTKTLADDGIDPAMPD
jgi:predicted HAD superfamily Cof-like phosphohydrolase